MRDRAASISLRQLKLFESVARLQSVRRASEECSLSQPAVTQALAKLEQQLGANLLERRVTGSYLNELGEIFYRRTKRFFDQMESAVADLGVPSGTASRIANRITRQQLRALVAFVETGGIAAAAEASGVSQVSLHRAVRDLENNLRKPLLARTAAGLMMTPTGVEFSHKLKVAAQEIDWGLEELEAARGGCATKITLGALPFGGSMLLAHILEEFVTAHPTADVTIINEGASEMIRRLRAGDVDFVVGLVQETVAKDLANEAIAQTPYVVVARRHHPLARKAKVSVDSLLAHDWVIGTPGSSRRTCFERLFSGAKGRPKATIQTCSLPVIRRLLNQSNRLTLMTSFELAHEDQLVALRVGPIDPSPAIGVTMRANWLPTRLHLDFVELMRARFADLEAKAAPNAGV